jgi:hypothetical protein
LANPARSGGTYLVGCAVDPLPVPLIQCIIVSSRAPSLAVRTIGARWSGKIAVFLS